MKTMLISFLFTSLTIAQSNAQLFGQQGKKTKLMMEQIADLEIYLHILKSGYQIAGKGLQTAHELKNGSYGLHTAYFHSLKEVNPVIAADPTGKAVYDLQEQIVDMFSREMAWQQEKKLLTREEYTHLQSVYTNLLDESQEDLDAVIQLLTPSKLQFSDQQRIERLTQLYLRMKNRRSFAGHFTTECHNLALQRQQTQEEKRRIREVYDIN